jgi:hypothetical protein
MSSLTVMSVCSVPWVHESDGSGSEPRTVGGTTLSYIPNEADCISSFVLSSAITAPNIPSIQSVSNRWREIANLGPVWAQKHAVRFGSTCRQSASEKVESRQGCPMIQP